jgi:hypothetical protein
MIGRPLRVANSKPVKIRIKRIRHMSQLCRKTPPNAIPARGSRKTAKLVFGNRRLGRDVKTLVELGKIQGFKEDISFKSKPISPDVLNALKTCFVEAPTNRPAHETTEKRGIAAIPA